MLLLLINLALIIYKYYWQFYLFLIYISMKRNRKSLKQCFVKMCSDKDNNRCDSSVDSKKKKVNEILYKDETPSKSNESDTARLCRNNIKKNKNLYRTSNPKEKVEIKGNSNTSYFVEKGENLDINNTSIKKNYAEILKKPSKFADIAHKGCTGYNNWEKFLIEQGTDYVINKCSDNSSKERKSKPPSISKSNRLTKVVGMDCEMVGAGEDGKENLLARVSIVNLFGDCLYDKFVKPRETVTDYRTHVSGVRAADLKHAEEFETVQKDVAALIKGKILVGHAIKNDLEVLFLSHPRHQIRDTAKFFRKKGTGTPSLKNLAYEYLNVRIQTGEHSSIQDAQAAVQLYNMFRKQWETGGGNKKTNRIDTSQKL